MLCIVSRCEFRKIPKVVLGHSFGREGGGNTYRGYNMVARRYEFYFRVVKTIFYKRVHRVSKDCFLLRENKLHTNVSSSCHVIFFLLYRQEHFTQTTV